MKTILEYVINQKIRLNIDDVQDLVDLIKEIFKNVATYHGKEFKGKIYKSWLKQPSDTGIMYFDFYRYDATSNILDTCKSFVKIHDNLVVEDKDNGQFIVTTKENIKNPDPEVPSLKYTVLGRLYINYPIYIKLFDK